MAKLVDAASLGLKIWDQGTIWINVEKDYAVSGRTIYIYIYMTNLRLAFNLV